MAKSRTLTQLAIDLKTEGSTKGLPARLRKLMKALASDGESALKTSYVSSGLGKRTSNLFNSLASSALSAEQGLGVELRAGGRTKTGARVPYAAIQEFGGTIKGRPYLRVPLQAAKTPTGVDRFASPLRETGAGLFHLVEANGKLFLFRTDEEDGPPWYVLQRTSTIRARPYMRPAMRKLQRRVPNDLRELVTVSITGGV